MFKVVEKRECYEELNIEERKKVFKGNILKLWNKDQKKFDENMKDEEKLKDLSMDIKKDLGNISNKVTG